MRALIAMTYDNTCKFIAENFTEDVTGWLLGRPVELVRLEPSELALEPIRADTLVLLQSADLIFPIEFQTDPDEAIPWRVENCVYYVRDVTQGEERSRIRTGFLPHLWAVARNLAINLYRAAGFTNMAQARRSVPLDLSTFCPCLE